MSKTTIEMTNEIIDKIIEMKENMHHAFWTHNTNPTHSEILQYSLEVEANLKPSYDMLHKIISCDPKVYNKVIPHNMTLIETRDRS